MALNSRFVVCAISIVSCEGKIDPHADFAHAQVGHTN